MHTNKLRVCRGCQDILGKAWNTQTLATVLRRSNVQSAEDREEVIRLTRLTFSGTLGFSILLRESEPCQLCRQPGKRFPLARI